MEREKNGFSFSPKCSSQKTPKGFSGERTGFLRDARNEPPKGANGARPKTGSDCTPRVDAGFEVYI